jgi:hypothetical protein
MTIKLLAWFWRAPGKGGRPAMRSHLSLCPYIDSWTTTGQPTSCMAHSVKLAEASCRTERSVTHYSGNADASFLHQQHETDVCVSATHALTTLTTLYIIRQTHRPVVCNSSCSNTSTPRTAVAANPPAVALGGRASSPPALCSEARAVRCRSGYLLGLGAGSWELVLSLLPVWAWIAPGGQSAASRSGSLGRLGHPASPIPIRSGAVQQKWSPQAK